MKLAAELKKGKTRNKRKKIQILRIQDKKKFNDNQKEKRLLKTFSVN
jgi:hypothetical protein